MNTININNKILSVPSDPLCNCAMVKIRNLAIINMFIFSLSKVHKSVNNASEKEKLTKTLSQTWYTNLLKLNRRWLAYKHLLQCNFISALIAVYYFMKCNLSTQNTTHLSTQEDTQHYFNSVYFDLLGGSS